MTPRGARLQGRAPAWAPAVALLVVGGALALVPIALRPPADLVALWDTETTYHGTAPAGGADVHRVDVRLPASAERQGLALDVSRVQLAARPLGLPGAAPFRVQLVRDGQVLADRVLTPGDPGGLTQGPAVASGPSGRYELRVSSATNASVPYELGLTLTFALTARADGVLVPPGWLLAAGIAAAAVGGTALAWGRRAADASPGPEAPENR